MTWDVILIAVGLAITIVAIRFAPELGPDLAPMIGLFGMVLIYVTLHQMQRNRKRR